MAVVLVVDDRPVNRELVRTVLGHCGHDTVEAGAGTEALTLLAHQRPDLVLTDVVMPGMDGYQLARAIRSDPAHQGIPVLFYTASHSAAKGRPIAGAAGVSRIVPKTGDLAALIEAVEDALSTPEGTGRRNEPSAEAREEARLEAHELTSAAMRQSQDASQDVDLRDSIRALSRLATGELELKELLTRVTEYAVAAIPGADGAGLTLLEKGQDDTTVASTPFVVQVHAIQYSIEEGPGLTAALEGRMGRSGGLSGDPRWPHFGPRAARLGVNSVLSLPLLAPDRVVGALNVYAHPLNAFDDRAAQIGELFTVPAAIVVQNAQVLAQTKRLAQQLQSALTSRAVIDQALGILMSRAGSTAEEAFGRLRERSQADNVKLRDVAQRVVDEAVRRARARRANPRANSS